MSKRCLGGVWEELDKLRSIEKVWERVQVGSGKESKRSLGKSPEGVWEESEKYFAVV